MPAPVIPTQYVPLARTFGSSLDLRPNVDVVEDQASENSCTGNAHTTQLEIMEELAGRPAVQYSRNFTYWNSRNLLSITGDIGSTGIASAQASSQFGVCTEDLWPYDLNRVNTQPTPDAYTDASSRKVTAWETVASVDDLKSALSDKMPVIFRIPVPQGYLSISGTLAEQYQSYTKHGAPFCCYGNIPIGYHEQVIIGWHDEFEGWLVQNSWGPSWGDGGFAIIPYTAMWRDASEFVVVREFNGVSIPTNAQPDPFATQLTALIQSMFGRGPTPGEIDAWRATGANMNVIRWSLSTTPEFKTRLKTYFPAFYASIYGSADPSSPLPPTPRGPGDY